MSTEEMAGDGLERLSLLASALSGSAVGVAPVEAGEATWTDGKTIFVNVDSDSRDQIGALAVQASLLAAGSLKPDTVRKLARRAAVAKRYLAVEGHRALAANEDVLPPAVRRLIDFEVAAATSSPEDSLIAAFGRDAIADPPDVFGAIRVRALLPAWLSASKGADKPDAGDEHIPRRQGDKAYPRARGDRSPVRQDAGRGAPGRRGRCAGRRRADTPDAIGVMRRRRSGALHRSDEDGRRRSR